MAIRDDVRVVLEVHDIDPTNPGSLQAISTVLYDGVVTSAPGYCSYALVDSLNLHVSIDYAQLQRVVEAEVRSAPPMRPIVRACWARWPTERRALSAATIWTSILLTCRRPTKASKSDTAAARCRWRAW